MTPTQLFALSLDPALSFPLLGFQADPWQQDFLRSRARRIPAPAAALATVD